MYMLDQNTDHETELGASANGPIKAIDFTVDSAGNVSPLTRRKAESLADREPPPRSGWRQLG